MRLVTRLLASAAALLPACATEPGPAPPPVAATSALPTAVTAAPLAAVSSAPAPPSPGASSSVAPLTTHPRLWLTAADLPRLRGWATAANPLYKDGLRRALDQAIGIYDKDFFPGGKENATWPDPGTQAWVGRSTEAYAQFFAFCSLIDPDPAARAQHAERARRLLMHVMNEAVKGVDPDRQHPGPFRSAVFATHDRANLWGEAWGVTVDWLYPSLSAADKATIRKVFMRWSDDLLHAATSNEEHPKPVGLLNDPKLVADTKALRWTANNYFAGHMRHLTLMGLSLDAEDDPPLDPAAPAGKLGNTLRSYLDDAVGAWIYQQYAIYEEPAVAAAALGVPAAGLGATSGGLSPEGFLYGTSIGWMHEGLLGLYTAGRRDPRTLGPQIRLIESAYWDRYVDGYLQSVVPVPTTVPGQEYVGPVYQMAAYGDLQRFWITPDAIPALASVGLYAARAGNTARLEKVRWILENVIEGGAARFPHRVADIWGNSYATSAILTFLLFDPAAPPPVDPRPSMPRTFFDKALGRLLARTGPGPDATLFDFKCSWETIGHQFGDCNQIELYRKGEWLAKERSAYANDQVLMTPVYHDTVSIQNTVSTGADKPRSLQWFEGPLWTNGGTWPLGNNAGDPHVLTSSAPSWVYAFGDGTQLYNRVNQWDPADRAEDVQHASRSIVWLMPDQVVVYDRATTKTDGRFKRWNLTLAGDTKIAGRRATVTTPKGQQLFVESLLPAAATLTTYAAEPLNGVAQGEPVRSRLVVEDPKGPRDVRFLHVLEGADAGATPARVAMVQSSAGTAFAGAVVGTRAVLFPVEVGAAFTRVTYAVPAAVTGQVVTGLTPGAAYEVSLKTVGGNVEVTIAPGGGEKADEAGVLAIGAAKKP